MSERQPDAEAHVSSQGHPGAFGTYLDAHFDACRPEYEAMLRSVGLRPGWRVPDAGCGRGNFLPTIAEAVGPTGAMAALDLAPENVATLAAVLPAWGLTTPVTAHVGSVLALPFPTASSTRSGAPTPSNISPTPTCRPRSRSCAGWCASAGWWR